MKLKIKALLNGKPITFIRPSSVTGWNYHFTVQVDNSSIIVAIVILLVCLVLSIAGGLFLCFILAKKQYVPVDKLLAQLDVEKNELVTDEYNAIRSQIEKLKDDSMKIEKYTEKYYSLLRKKILTDLILGDNVSIVEKALKEDSRLLPLDSDSFFLLCIFSTKLPENPVLHAGINHMEVLAGSLTDKVRDYFHDTATVYSVTINHALYLLINPTEELNDEGVSLLYKDLFEITSEVRKYILQSMDISLSAAVSNPHHSVKCINDAYLETESVREIIMQNPNFSPILCYHELHRSEKDVADRTFREQDLITYVNINFVDPDMCLKTFAAKYNLSTTYVSRIFKKSTGSTLTDYIHMLRLNLAKKYLTEGMTLNDISEKCGYANTLTLIRAFKKYEGVTPSEYKKRNKNRYCAGQ
jgi:AraC-like DNA-binding protein/biotin operon repressor